MTADPSDEAPAVPSVSEVDFSPSSELDPRGRAITEGEEEARVLDAIRRQSAVTGYATEYLVGVLLQAEAAEKRPIIERLVAAGRVTRTPLGHWGSPGEHALRANDDERDP